MADPVSSPAFPPGGVVYANSDGELGVQSGKVETKLLSNSTVPSNWVQRFHPLRHLWLGDELRQRASYIGTRRALSPYLVPHRFEGKERPEKLSRAQLGYAIGLNSAYLQEVFGHIRVAPAHYTWGVLGADTGPGPEKDTTQPPKGGLARDFWDDCTGDGTTWTNFFEGKVLEWMVTSPGGFILVDSNKKPSAGIIDRLLARKKGIRCSFKFIPASWVEDFGRGPRGYRWVKIAETNDERKPRMPDDSSGYKAYHIIYELLDDGRTQIRRFDDDGNQVGTTVFQKVLDMDGQGILPLIPARFGEHPDLPYMGAGVLMGLDEIVIDIYNLITEIREAYRDSVFTFLAYQGPDMQGVQDQLAQGTRLVHIGDDSHAKLERLGAQGQEVESGLKLLDVSLTNWAASAKRRAMEITKGVGIRSGTSLRAEFQLDLVPLMVAIVEALDAVEVEAMFVLAQMQGYSNDEADQLFVRREKDFQMEQEATRIARIITEFLQAVPGMPAVLLQKMIMRWADSIDFLNMDEMVDDGNGGKKKLRDVIEEQADEIAEADMQSRILQNQFGVLGAAALGKAAGGAAGKPGAAGGPGKGPLKPELTGASRPFQGVRSDQENAAGDAAGT